MSIFKECWNSTVASSMRISGWNATHRFHRKTTYHRLHSHHFSEYRTPRHAWFSSWVQGSTSLHVFSNCIGCLSAGASSLNDAVSCIRFLTETARRIYQTSFTQWVPADRVFAYDHSHQPTTCYHDFVPSWRARLFLRWSFFVEQTAGRHSRRIRHRELSEASQNSLF